VLLVLQGALSVVLLVGAGLFVRSLNKVNAVRLGYDVDPVLLVDLNMRGENLDSVASVGLLDRLYQAALTIPGVQHVSRQVSVPFWSTWSIGLYVQGIDTVGKLGQFNLNAVSPDYFATLHIPLKRGRLISAEDHAGAPPAAVVSEEAVRRFFSDGRDPIGSRITFGNPANPDTKWMTIVGLVGNIAQEGVTAKPYAQLFRSIDQSPTRVVHVSLRTDRDPMLLASSVRGTVRSVDPDLLVNDIQTLEARVSQNIARPRLSVFLLGGFSAIALLLAAIGIYGVMAYTVAQRTREIGVRMALGADPHEVKQLVVRQGMRPALVGVVVGLVAAFAATRLIASLLYGVSAVDPVTFVLVPLFLIAVALLATYLPARRATRVPPTVALQTE